MKRRRVFDETFKRIAVELSHAKGSVQEAAHELGIDSIAPANRSNYQMAATTQKIWSVGISGHPAKRGAEAN